MLLKQNKVFTPTTSMGKPIELITCPPKIDFYIELLPIWYNPHAQDFKNVDISWGPIVLTKNPLYYLRKPQEWSHYNVSQVMMNRVR